MPIAVPTTTNPTLSGAIHSFTDGPNGLIYFYFPGDAIPPEHDPGAIAPSTPAPNWAQFRLGILADPGFLRVVNYGLPIHQAALASEINQNPPNQPTMPALRLLWEAIILQVPVGAEPTAAEISAWNAIATAANVPVQFGTDGRVL